MQRIGKVGGPGHWPDCDMIQIGKLSKRGPGWT